MANKNPPDNTGKKYNVSEFTPKQEKFIDIYCSKYGKYSAAECAACWLGEIKQLTPKPMNF